MDNYRGFSNTLLPLKQINFLVGENSTGKSSFLKLLYIMSHPKFWFSPEFVVNEDVDLGNFHDIVSAWASDKSYFRIGILSTQKENKKGVLSCIFAVHTFTSKDGSPFLSHYTEYIDNTLTELSYAKKHPTFRSLQYSESFQSEEDIIRFFNKNIQLNIDEKTEFRKFPANFPSKPPIPIALAIMRSITKGKPLDSLEFSTEIPFALNFTWIAPIRTKPQRFYDGMKRSFSPEGDHTPFILKRSMRLRTKSPEFSERLKKFGEASGLFQTVAPHSFDKSPQSPFELLVKFSDVALNINNVGYGVSQVLPLIVEFLSREKNRTYAVQQPEVHLHPRAQAALGELIFQLAKEKGHHFILETHSDYLIDRCRLCISHDKNPPQAQVIFFQRSTTGNSATTLNIESDGKYPDKQPTEFRDFFIKEEMNLLEV